jgi:hypothetical protein
MDGCKAIKNMKKYVMILVAMVCFVVSANAQDVVVVNEANELLANNSSCSWGVWDGYDSYCQSHKIYYTNTCNQRAYVYIKYRITPKEGYRGSIVEREERVWLSRGYSNATLVDCNRTVDVRLLNKELIRWEDDN